MKGIILAGGTGTRLHPITKSVCKQLLPVYDKPMIYYPLSILMMAGIKEILLISTPQDLGKFEQILGNGEQLGISLAYIEQIEPRGIAEAFILGDEFIGDSPVSLILGDNIFFGHGLPEILQSVDAENNATVFGYWVKDPSRYGVVEFDKHGSAVSIEEKPENPKSNYAVTGLYFYPTGVAEVAKRLKPSERNELEITDLNLEYMKAAKLKMEILGRGMAWLDTGTSDSMLDASNYVATIERRQGLKIGCIEEVAYNMGFICREELKELTGVMSDNSYKEYLEMIIKRSLSDDEN